MPAAGIVQMELSPAEARAVAAWLRSKPAPLYRVAGVNVPLLNNGVRADLVQKLEKIASRKRRGSDQELVKAEFERDDLIKLEAQFYTGMFGRKLNPLLPEQVRYFATRCFLALHRKPGPQRKFGNRLDEAYQRLIHNVTEHDTDPRQMFRVRKLKRENDAQMQEIRERMAKQRRKTVEFVESLGLDSSLFRDPDDPAR